jgi:hypothetical protein
MSHTSQAAVRREMEVLSATPGPLAVTVREAGR